MLGASLGNRLGLDVGETVLEHDVYVNLIRTSLFPPQLVTSTGGEASATIL